MFKVDHKDTATTTIASFWCLYCKCRVGLDRGRRWLVDFNVGKTQLVSFDRSNNTGAVDVKMNRSVLEEKSIF